jgi:hypothetical protein
METPGRNAPETSLSANELEILRDLVRALRSLRYGSVILTMHDGHLVEIQKTEKIRMNPSRPTN